MSLYDDCEAEPRESGWDRRLHVSRWSFHVSSSCLVILYHPVLLHKTNAEKAGGHLFLKRRKDRLLVDVKRALCERTGGKLSITDA